MPNCRCTYLNFRIHGIPTKLHVSINTVDVLFKCLSTIKDQCTQAQHYMTTSSIIYLHVYSSLVQYVIKNNSGSYSVYVKNILLQNNVFPDLSTKLPHLLSDNQDIKIINVKFVRTRFSVGFPEISRLCSAFIFLRWFKLAHIYIQVSTTHNGGEQGIVQQIFNRKSISRKIAHPQNIQIKSRTLSLLIQRESRTLSPHWLPCTFH